MKDRDFNDIDIMEEVRNLNEQLFELFGRFNENKNFFEDPKYKENIAYNIFHAYERKMTILELRYEWLYAREEYKLTTESNLLTPKRKRHWYWPFKTKPNKAAEVIEQRAAIEFDKILDTQRAKIDELYDELFPAEPAEPSEPAPTDPAEPKKPSEPAPTDPAEPAQTDPEATAPPQEEQPKKPKKHKRGNKNKPAADSTVSYGETPFLGGAQITFDITTDPNS